MPRNYWDGEVAASNGDYRYKADFESHLLFFDPGSLGDLLRRHDTVVDVSTVGKPAAQLNITQVLSGTDSVASVQGTGEDLIAAVTPQYTKRRIARYAMSAYRGDRQWLRALVQRH